MKIKISSIKEIIFALCIVGATCEFLYCATTGEKTSVVLAALTVCCVVFSMLYNAKFVESDLYKFAVAVWVLVWTVNVQSVRYFLTLIMLICLSKTKINNLEKLVHFLVLFGTALSVFQIAGGQARIYGFYASSPTQYACTLFAFELYLLVVMANKRFQKLSAICSILCVVGIYLTETRSVLLASSVVFAVYWVMILSHAFGAKSKIYIIAFFVLMIVPFVLLNNKAIMALVQGNFHRTNIVASNYTRYYLYNRVIEMIRDNPAMLILGKKGGFIRTQFQTNGVYLPVHQDFLLILMEYGIVGMAGIYFAFLKRHKGRLFFLILFAVCSFHNILLNPIALVFFVLFMVDIENNEYNLLPIKRKKKKEYDSSEMIQRTYGEAS